MRFDTQSVSRVRGLRHETGNAEIDGSQFRDWIVGHFIPSEFGDRSTGDLEIKWGIHDAGEGENEWSVNKTATTMSILLRGKDCIYFPDGETLLDHEGDYVIWGPGVPHRWRAIEPSVVLTVRWPSTARDVIRLGDDGLEDYLAGRRFNE
jgi:hypothetical protein